MSDAPKRQCVEGWVDDAGELVPEADRAYARELVDWCLDEILRNNQHEVVKRRAVTADRGRGSRSSTALASPLRRSSASARRGAA